jgi:thiol:disulfide interchange protein DsbD
MEQAQEYAKKVDKPIFVDITGKGCVNCRNMEANVWSDPKVLKLLSEEYVIVALYMDVREEAYKEDWVTKPDGEVLKTIGEINTDYIIKTFGVNSQPYYFLLGSEGERLVKPRAFDLDVDAFVKFLEQGVKEYKK